jgi:hypothetical protein
MLTTAMAEDVGFAVGLEVELGVGMGVADDDGDATCWYGLNGFVDAARTAMCIFMNTTKKTKKQ